MNSTTAMLMTCTLIKSMNTVINNGYATQRMINNAAQQAMNSYSYRSSYSNLENNRNTQNNVNPQNNMNPRNNMNQDKTNMKQ